MSQEGQRNWCLCANRGDNSEKQINFPHRTRGSLGTHRQSLLRSHICPELLDATPRAFSNLFVFHVRPRKYPIPVSAGNGGFIIFRMERLQMLGRGDAVGREGTKLKTKGISKSKPGMVTLIQPCPSLRSQQCGKHPTTKFEIGRFFPGETKCPPIKRLAQSLKRADVQRRDANPAACQFCGGGPQWRLLWTQNLQEI